MHLNQTIYLKNIVIFILPKNLNWTWIEKYQWMIVFHISWWQKQIEALLNLFVELFFFIIFMKIKGKAEYRGMAVPEII